MYKRLKITAILLLVFLLILILPKKSSALIGSDIASWTSTSQFSTETTASHPLPSFAARGYYYVLLTDRSIKYAKINTDGSFSAWSTATKQHNEGSGRGYTAVVVGDIPYLLRFGRVEKLIIADNGNVTDIQQVGSGQGENDSIGGNYYYWNSAVVAKFDATEYVFNLGGFDCCSSPHYNTNNRIFRAANTSSNSWGWTEIDISKPYRNPYKATFFKPAGSAFGFIYLSDLNEENNPNPLYRIKVKSDASFDGGFVNSGNLPAKDQLDSHSLGEIFTFGPTLFVVRGRKVYSASINPADGSLSEFSDTPADLPETEIDKNWGPSVDGDHTDGTSYSIIANRIYLAGQKKVFSAQLSGDTNPTVTQPPAANPTTPAFIGDANDDGKVNILDFEILRQEYPREGVNLRADFNNDNIVNSADLTILKDTFAI